MQKLAFYSMKDDLLQDKRPPFEKQKILARKTIKETITKRIKKSVA